MARPAAQEGRAAPAAQTEVVQAPGESLPFPDDCFDTVALTLVLCTVPDPDAVLREVERVLKPGGRFLFLEHVRAREDRAWRAGRTACTGPGTCSATAATATATRWRLIAASPLEVERADEGSIPGGAARAAPVARRVYRLSPSTVNRR